MVRRRHRTIRAIKSDLDLSPSTTEHLLRSTRHFIEGKPFREHLLDFDTLADQFLTTYGGQSYFSGEDAKLNWNNEGDREQIRRHVSEILGLHQVYSRGSERRRCMRQKALNDRKAQVPTSTEAPCAAETKASVEASDNPNGDDPTPANSRQSPIESLRFRDPCETAVPASTSSAFQELFHKVSNYDIHPLASISAASDEVADLNKPPTHAGLQIPLGNCGKRKASGWLIQGEEPLRADPKAFNVQVNLDAASAHNLSQCQHAVPAIGIYIEPVKNHFQVKVLINDGELLQDRTYGAK